MLDQVIAGTTDNLLLDYLKIVEALTASVEEAQGYISGGRPMPNLTPEQAQALLEGRGRAVDGEFVPNKTVSYSQLPKMLPVCHADNKQDSQRQIGTGNDQFEGSGDTRSTFLLSPVLI